MSDENLRALLGLNQPGTSSQPSTSSQRMNFGQLRNGFPIIESGGPIHAQEEWDLNEAVRRSTEPRRTIPRRQMQHRDRDDDDDGEDVPKEKWNKLEIQLKQLAGILRQKETEKEQETDPVRRYINRVDAPETIKIFNKNDYGFRILQDSRTEAEQLLIDQSNFEMLKFVYSKHPLAMQEGRAAFDWGTLEVELYEHVDRFLMHHSATSFRQGAFSVTMDFDSFPPKLTWRGRKNEASLITLRPVVVDGVAVLKATRPFDDLWRPFFGNATETPLYDEVLNLPVKAIFEVILDFTIRGHKTVVYLPKYYKNYITNGGICKVDDLYAFKKLLADQHIRFLDDEMRNGWNWFSEVSKMADQIGAVFVSTTEYRRRKPDMKYEMPSERIITPCFWNTEDRVMVLEPSIRYKEKPEDATFKVIPAEEVLQFTESDDEQMKLTEQLYLHTQIETICKLCQLYPAGSRHRINIQQLLHLVVRAESDFKMPGMDLQTYSTLFDRFQSSVVSNLLNRLAEDNNSNNGFD